MRRRIGPFNVAPIGLGCMPLSHAYGLPPERDDAIRLLNRALDLGYDHLDSAALYGFGANEIAIPGTTSQLHLEENFAAASLPVGSDVLAAVDSLFEPTAVAGRRYNEATLAEIDTEEFVP